MDSDLYKTFGEALAIGLLVGVERYKDREPGEKKSVGIRTVTVFSLLGAGCGLLEHPTFTAVTLGGLALLLVVGYYRESVKSLGVTTEVAALLTFWLGYMMHRQEALAISLGIVLAILLASKRALHQFVREELTEIELWDTLKFLAVVFVVFPLLPNRDIGPYGFLNPRHIWGLIIVVSTIGYVGYVLTRLLGPRRGLRIGAILGGIVSTTAATMSLAARARQAPDASRLFGITAVMANAVQFPRLLLLVWVVDRNLGQFLTLPLLTMGGVGLVGAWILGRGMQADSDDRGSEWVLQNPYSMMPALKFGLFFTGVFLISRLTTVWWGEQGIYLTSAAAGMGDVSAIALSAAKLVGDGSLTVVAGSVAILIGVTMNALLKCGLTLFSGGRHMALWLGTGLAAMLISGIAVSLVLYIT